MNSDWNSPCIPQRPAVRGAGSPGAQWHSSNSSFSTLLTARHEQTRWCSSSHHLLCSSLTVHTLLPPFSGFYTSRFTPAKALI